MSVVVVGGVVVDIVIGCCLFIAAVCLSVCLFVCGC